MLSRASIPSEAMMHFPSVSDSPISEKIVRLVENFSNLTFPKKFLDFHLPNLQTAKVPLESQAQGTSLFTSAASNQRGCPKVSPETVHVRMPEGQSSR